MRHFSFIFSLLLVTATFLGAGCMSTMTVQTNPRGATIRARGVGRPSYKWKSVGITKEKDNEPCQFTVPYSTVMVYARWPDGTRSETRKLSVSNWKDPEPLVLTKSAAASKRAAENN